jgi:hypothetical protein
MKKFRKRQSWNSNFFRCSSCARFAWRKHGGWGRNFICSQCLTDLSRIESTGGFVTC